MKRKKQIVALLMVALMVIGGILPTPGSLGSVRAEEMQTEQASVSSGNEADVQPAESDIDQSEVLEPDIDQSEVLEPDQSESLEPDQPETSEADQSEVTLPEKTDDADAEEMFSSVSGNDNSVLILPERTGEQVYTASVAKGNDLAAGTNYGDDVVNITVLGEITYKSSEKATIDEKDYVGAFVGKANPKYENGEGSAATEGTAYKITVTQQTTLEIAAKFGSTNDKKYYFVTVDENGNASFVGGPSDIKTENMVFTFQLEPGNIYYYYVAGSKATVYDISYSYEKKVELEEYTASVAKGNDLAAGTNYGDDVVNITVLGEITYKSSEKATIDEKDYVGAFVGKANPKYENGEGSAATEGTAYKITVTHQTTLTIAAKFGSTNDKKYYFVTVDENGNTSFVGGPSDIKTENTVFTFELEPGNTYYYYVAGSKATVYDITYTYMREKEEEPEIPPVELVEGVLAFPTAEGGGRLATGGRGGEVYIVTNLNDSGEGSLRYGIETAPETGRIIVFNVGGTIHLQSTLTFKNKKNITIAGQTAPGDGITIAGYDTNISDSENIIIRYVRFRVGTENLLKGGDSMDALWGRDNDTFIIDHCTFSWNTDETLSTYRGQNGTVQWCLISESLTVSGHSKGRHGYGGIFGGDNTVFQYNLLTNHTSRNPRIGGGFMGDPTAQNPPNVAKVQLNNNVLYNHGYFACYGGGFTYTNYINNYVKPGQGTRDSLNDTLLSFGENNKIGGVYYAGNILEGNPEVTADNNKGFKLDSSDGQTEVATTPYISEAFDNVTVREAQECYDLVLNSAGATYPHRDAVDARVVAQVKTNTGTYINTQDEVGGYPAATCESTETDSDNDGIPDAWEDAHGLDKNDPSDSRTLCLNDPDDKSTYGYSWIEVYFNELVGETSKPDYVAENPTVSIDLPDNTLVEKGKSVTVTADASSSKGIEKVEFYNGADCVGTATEAPYSFTYTDSIAKDGTYHISARAYDKAGNKTQSNTSRLHVNSTAGVGDWENTDIGTPEVKGTASLVDGVLTIKGAGKIGASEGSNKNLRPELSNAADDDFHFVYQQMEGNVEIVTRFDSYTPVDNHTFQGLMFRSSLEDDAAMAALGFTMVKVDETTIWSSFMVNREADGGNVQDISETIDSPEAAAKAGIPLIANLPFKEGNDYLGTWLKLSREGDDFTGYVSSDGLVWQKVGTLTVDLPDTAYVGFAVDANRAGNDLINYGTAKFSNIEINNAFANITYTSENINVAGADKLAIGKDLAVTLSKVTGYVLPDTVEVIIGGKTAVQGEDYTYNKETGIIQVLNVQGDISISAFGVKRVVLPVEYEVVDENNLLTVTQEAGKLILEQVAESGNMQSTNRDSGAHKDAVNVSYLLFPEVDEYHELSMKVTVTSLTKINKGDENGFYLGAFATDGSGVYTTLAFRANEVLKGFWYKPGGVAGQYTGDGNPGFSPFVMDREYNVRFVTNGKGGYNAIVSGKTYDAKGNIVDGTFTKEFKAGESVIQTGDSIRYGIAIIGATVEISDMKLVDPENNVIYNQNSADYSKVIAAIQKASNLNANDYVDFSGVEAAWDAVDLGLDASEQAKVDAMAKAIEDAIAALEKKPNLADYSAVDAAIEKADKLNAEDYENFDAVTAALNAVVRGLSEKEQAKVDAMAKAIEDAIAALEKKQKDTEELEVEITKGISESALTDAVREKTKCTTVEELTKYVREEVLKGSYAGASCIVLDVTLKVRINGGEPIDANEENIPSEGVDIILPYPEGTNKNDYDFIVGHLITKGWNGQKEIAGTMEYPPVTKTDKGLKVHVLSASPFVIAWKTNEKTPENNSGGNTENKDNTNTDNVPGETVGTNVTTQAVQTGDNMDAAAIIWSFVLLAAVAGAGALVYFRKRRTDQSKPE